MIRHYFKTAFRNLRKSPLYGAINIIGLSSGIGVCLLILVYVAHERSYDRFHRHVENIYSLEAGIHLGDQVIRINDLSYPSGPMSEQASPHVRAFVRTRYPGSLPVTGAGGKTFFENNLIFADSNFFHFFTFPLLEGNPSTVLSEPFQVVLSERTARKYFGKEDPVGKTLRCWKDNVFTVSGVAADPPSNSTIDFDFVASMSSLSAIGQFKNDLGGQVPQFGPFETWLYIDRSADTAVIASALIKRAAADSNTAAFHFQFSLAPMTGVHLNTIFGRTAAVKYVNIFPLVAGLILLLALINYMSMATARASVRAAEIGVRKVIGAGRRSVAMQFYSESFLYALLAFGIGLALFFLLEPWFSELVQIHISSAFLRTPLVLGLFIALFAVTVLAAGSYPALFLSRFRPVDTLYGKLSKSGGGAFVRKTFTILQFCIAVTLIVFCWTVNRQLNLFRHMEGSLNRNRILMAHVTGAACPHIGAIRADLQSIAGVQSVGTTSYQLYNGFTAYSIKGPGQKSEITLKSMVVDSTAFRILGMRWAIPPADRQVFDRARVTLLNETATRKLGLYPNPVGKKLDLGHPTPVDGILRDFTFESPQKPIDPLMVVVTQDSDRVFADQQAGSWLILQMSPGAHAPAVLSSTARIFSRFDPDHNFEDQFMEDAYEKLFGTENRMAGLMDLFTALTILIACLGLFGLATFTAAQRTKEIGIRKVLGAGAGQIVGLLTRDFLMLIGLAVLIACPVAGWCTLRWMQGFAYKVGLSPWVFAGTGLGIMILALGTVIVQALRAAWANPVHSLRTE